LVRGLGLSPEGNVTGLKDISNQWYSAYVGTAVKFGLLSGYPDKNFKPNQAISREELAAILIKAIKLAGSQEAVETNLSVNSRYQDQGAIADWARQDVALATSMGIMQGRGQDQFAPQAAATRAEAAVLVQSILRYCSLSD